MKKGLPKQEVGYQPPETIKLIYCIAVLEVVLKENKEAKELYSDIKGCWGLPGIQEIFNKLEKKIPSDEKMIRSIITKAGYNYRKTPPEDNPAKVARALIVGFKELIANFTKKLMLWVIISGKRRRHLKMLSKSIDRLLRVGFNKESEQVKGKYKITASISNTLATMVLIRAMIETYNMNFNKLGKIPMLKHGKHLYSVDTVMAGNLPDRAYRSLVSQYLGAEYRRMNDSRIDNIAKHWYQCRVVHSGPKEYCLHLLKTTGEILDPANLSNEIKECDEAIGYAREKTGKRKK